jgi:Methylamine utilisation protein MauE
MPYLLLALRCLVGATFLASSASKVSSRESFRKFAGSLQDMRIVPPHWAKSTAAVVVALEIGICAVLAVPHRDAGIVGFVLAAGLLLAFTAGIVVSMRKGVEATCGCFGPSSSTLGRRHLTRNLFLAAAALIGAYLMAEGSSNQMHPGGAVAAAGAGVVLAAFVITLDDIVALFGAPTRSSGSH